ncbi:MULTISPECIES: hypothetical protein [unclassified Haloferax]|uniref:hypothetical protein n=1 Tax=unclassified Haloferax TaxID=2625095 RepID=UPI0028746CED|nr:MULTISPECIES: hypothetical protein [unclassified Haloferax]MDS0243547.1 hypothetical protein [Haloferax sp. S2CR25]MDS0446668.1 hypothetical protein [Haloferax sp. S2CR25-2]
MSDLIDYSYGGENVMLRFDTVTEALAAYRESIQRVDSPDDIDAYNLKTEEGLPELLVGGVIPTDAIVDVI